MSIIALLALVRRDKGILPYLLLLACFGVLISSFHYYEQVRALLDPVGFDPHTPCDLTGISCRATYVLQYGFVTIPLMSFALFSLSAVTAWIALQCQKK
jgi:disulfide bond formation protein DsbB